MGQWVFGWNDKFLIEKQKTNIVRAKTNIEMLIGYQKFDYMTPLFSHFTSVWFSCGDLWKSTFVVVLSVYLVLPVYGFSVCIFVCVHVNLNLSSIALACNISRARGAEAWHLSVTHLLCPSLMMPAWWQIALHACHPLTDRRRERDRESEIERERRWMNWRKAQLICLYFPTLSQSEACHKALCGCSF